MHVGLQLSFVQCNLSFISSFIKLFEDISHNKFQAELRALVLVMMPLSSSTHLLVN